MRDDILLSLFLNGRNDQYMGDCLYRLRLTLDSIAEAFASAGEGQRIEVLVCDWGSEVPLAEEPSLNLSDAAKAVTRFIVVPPDFAEKAKKDSVWPETLMRNICIRRCTGRFYMSTNGDILFTRAFAHALLAALHAADCGLEEYVRPFIYCSRIHVPFPVVSRRLEAPVLTSLIERTNVYRQWQFDGVDASTLIGAIGDCQVMKAEMWHDMRGFDEKLLYWGWIDIDLARRASGAVSRVIDLSSAGGAFFHLEHYPSRGAPTRRMNPQVSNPFMVNADNADWGFAGEQFEIVQAVSAKRETA